MTDKIPFQVRPGWQDDWQPAMDVAWKTFLKFEAEDYSPEGIRNFNDFITDSELYRMFSDGRYPLFVACDKEQVIGMITLRNGNHISLLFVDEKYHKQGVGRALMQYTFDYLKQLNCFPRVTVFAAPYGIGFYHRLGFSDLGPQMSRDGILYTPMEYIFSEYTA